MSPSARHLRGKRLLYSVTNRDNPLSQLSLRTLNGINMQNCINMQNGDEWVIKVC